jgi:hypothetical protein
MTNWLERAKREIPPVTDLATAETAERGSTSVMAVVAVAKVEIAESSIGGNGSTSTAGPRVVRPDADQAGPLTETDVVLLRGWLASIGESDLAIIEDLLNKCRSDATARAYFLRHAVGAAKRDVLADDRRVCDECENLKWRVCSIAYPGGLVSAIRGYEPAPDVMHRCAGFVPWSVARADFLMPSNDGIYL